MATVDISGAYRFGTCLQLDEPAKSSLFRLFERSPGQSREKVLSGRVQPVQVEITGVGDVVVKYYRRGGFVRHFIKDRYLGIGISRSRHEYEMLETVRSLGILSPEPLMWATRGCLFYKAYLVTRKIEGHQSLSEIGTGDSGLIQAAVEKAAEQIRILVEHRIYHVDLHPGNVLMDSKGQAYIIDFDKARRVRWRRKKLCSAYIRRWQRAVKKYSLPTSMTDRLIEGLGASY